MEAGVGREVGLAIIQGAEKKHKRHVRRTMQTSFNNHSYTYTNHNARLFQRSSVTQRKQVGRIQEKHLIVTYSHLDTCHQIIVCTPRFIDKCQAFISNSCQIWQENQNQVEIISTVGRFSTVRALRQCPQKVVAY